MHDHTTGISNSKPSSAYSRANLTQAPTSLLFDWLQAELKLGKLGHSTVISALFTELTVRVEADPRFDLGEMCYFRNRLPCTQELHRQGEYGAALYQMRELARKFRPDDGEGAGSGVPLAPDPSPLRTARG